MKSKAQELLEMEENARKDEKNNQAEWQHVGESVQKLLFQRYGFQIISRGY